MQRFAFTLARVLAWRRAQATLERNRLEQIRTRQQGLVERRAALRQEHQASAEETARAGAKSERSGLALQESFARFARAEDQRLAHALAAVEQEIAAQQARVRDAEQASQLLEKLEGRRRDEWQAAAVKELEELASDVFLAQWPGRRKS